jgi:hypothetical protein
MLLFDGPNGLEGVVMTFSRRRSLGLVIALVGMSGPFAAQAEVIFEENFDDQPDWTSAMHSSDTVQSADTHIIPEGWYSIRQDPVWAPSTGHPDRHESIEILESNADKARSGSKSYVSWRDSYDAGWDYWGSESMMVKYFPQGYDQLYVEFWVRFDDNWMREYVQGTDAAGSKMFRISSWRGEGQGNEYQAFGGGDLGPIFIWDHNITGYGVRNAMSLRGGPHGDNYGFVTGDIEDAPRSLVGSGDLNMNFTGDVQGRGIDGTTPKIPDKLNGGFITTDPYASVSHDQIFGPGDTWTKMAFFVKMNSSPGAKDGVLIEWMDDQQIFKLETIPWIRPSTTEDENAKWNLVAIGGNDFFQTYPNDQRHEEWYAYDDLVIRTDIPSYLKTDTALAPPSAPPQITVD